MIIMVQKGITISETHLKYLDDKCIDISKFVAKCIQKEIDNNLEDER